MNVQDAAFTLALLAGIIGAMSALYQNTKLRRTLRELSAVKDAKRVLERTLFNLHAIKLGEPPCWHELKTWPEFFTHIWNGSQTVQVRKNDRDFKAGEGLILREYDPMLCRYKDGILKRVITHVGTNMTGVDRDYAVLSIRPVFDGEEK